MARFTLLLRALYGCILLVIPPTATNCSLLFLSLPLSGFRHQHRHHDVNLARNMETNSQSTFDEVRRGIITTPTSMCCSSFNFPLVVLHRGGLVQESFPTLRNIILSLSLLSFQAITSIDYQIPTHTDTQRKRNRSDELFI